MTNAKWSEEFVLAEGLIKLNKQTIRPYVDTLSFFKNQEIASEFKAMARFHETHPFLLLQSKLNDISLYIEGTQYTKPS